MLSRFARLPAATRLILFLTVALPFATASLVASGRYGAEYRSARIRELTTAADGIVQVAAGAAPAAGSEALLAGAAARGFNAAVYRRDATVPAHFLRVAGYPERFGDASLGGREVRRLLAQGRTMPGHPSGGSLSMLAPLGDPLEAKVAGALLLVDRRPAPPVLPTVPVAVGLIALLLLLWVVASYAERPTFGHALLVYLPSLAFFYWLLRGVAVAPDGGGYRSWTVALAAAWAGLATIGLGWLRLRQQSLGPK